jgi:hypothetical protein
MGDKIFAWDEQTGLWTDKPIGLYSAWCGVIHPGSDYGSSARFIRSSFAFTVELVDDRPFFEMAKANTRGKLLFRDGIWDKINECRLPFTSELFFPWV